MVMFEHKKVEDYVEKVWERNKKGIERSVFDDPKRKIFSFLEGPPTANAPPALHHMEARFMKDLVCRYKYMKGFSVPRKGGWDCHGLPVEVQVEKKLGLKSKKDVLKYGMARFNQRCREDVWTFINDWNKFTDKMGYLIDLKDPYITLNNNYIESEWWSLKELYSKKMLYEGHKVVPYCYRCGTALSSHEVAQGYSEVTDKTITVMFKIKGKNRYFLAWTTTPWTIPANLALAVSEKLNYSVVKKDDREFVLAESRVKEFFKDAKIVATIPGKDLVGTEYDPILPYFKGKLDKPAWKVVAGSFVSDTDGTGIVHIAPAFGEDDYNVIKENNMAFVEPVDGNGNFTNDVKEFAGRNVLESNADIIKFLSERGSLFSQNNYSHEYPFCWRCKEPLIYYATKSWFINVSQHRDKLMKFNEKINWFPENIKEGRFGNWIAEAKDWALSRSKFWGTPLPIWRCSCGHEEAIGSVKELKERTTKKLEGELDLHRPYVDEIRFRCPKCKGEMARVPEVIDTWYDSGSATFAQFHYPFENKELFEKRFPYDFIAEGADQTRGWFYTLHVLGALLFNKPAYRNVVCMGLLLDDKGEKMSKSKGNIINPWDIFNKYGVDAARLTMCISSPGDPKKVGDKSIEESVLPFLTILWNSYLYYEQFIKKIKPGKKLNIEDEWILSKVNTLVKTVEENIEKNEYGVCYSEMQRFIMNDLSRWYIKIIKDRASDEDPALAHTLNEVFTTFSKVLAPFAPYISDYIYSNVTGDKKSVHITDWPKIGKSDEKLERDMSNIMNIVEASNAQRLEKAIKLKYPLQSMTVACDADVKKSVKNLESILLKMANLKEVKVSKDVVEFDAKINYKIAGKKFGKDIKLIDELLKKHDATKVKESIDKTGKMKLDRFAVDKDDLIFTQKAVEGEKQFDGGKIYLDTKVSPELRQEWFVKELMRAIQDARKKLGLNVGQKIKVCIPEDDAFKRFEKTIKDSTGSTLVFSEPAGEKFEFEFEDRKYYFGVEV